MTSKSPAGLSPAGHGPPPRETHETNLSTQQPTSQTHAWLPRSHEQPGRAPDPQAPEGQGAEAADRQRSSKTAALTRPAGRQRQRLPRTRRIRKRPEFLKLQHGGRRRSGLRFVVITAPPPGRVSRIGITASRRVGGAVVRNRIKRLVREFFRRYQEQIDPPRDVLVIARPAAASATYADTRHELGKALGIDTAE